jgi:hypothetical protein
MAGVPDISLSDSAKGYSLMAFKEELAEVVEEKDEKLLFDYFLKFDCQNLALLLKNPSAEIDPRGNFVREQYEDLITSARQMNFNVHRFPSFMSVFAREYDYKKDKEGYFPEDDILCKYYEHAKNVPNKMMAEWYSINMDITNILTALIAKRYGWNIGSFIMGDNSVNEMLRTENSSDFGLVHILDYMPQLIKVSECDDPVEKEKMIDAIKWEWLEDKTFLDPFSIEAVFAYIAKLDILDRWALLDVEQGKETFRKIIDDLRGSARVPEEFTVAGTTPKK